MVKLKPAIENKQTVKQILNKGFAKNWPFNSEIYCISLWPALRSIPLVLSHWTILFEVLCDNVTTEFLII